MQQTAYKCWFYDVKKHFGFSWKSRTKMKAPGFYIQIMVKQKINQSEKYNLLKNCSWLLWVDGWRQTYFDEMR